MVNIMPGIYTRLCLLTILMVGTQSSPVYYSPDPLPPVVFVPGLAGNQLEWQVSLSPDDPSDCHFLNTDKWTRSWLDLRHFFPAHIDCWSRLMQLEYNVTTGAYSNYPGVETRVPGWGDTSTIEYVDPSYKAWMMDNVGQYAAPLINAMRSWGYSSTKNLHGAPYDFRYSGSSQPDNFEQRLKFLIETSYITNGKSRVVLMSHSMGGLVVHSFLSQQTQEWKDEYIRAVISMNTPWKGTVNMLQAVLSGYTWGHVMPGHMMIRRIQRNSQSGYYMFPKEDTWSPEEVVVQTDRRNYTTRDYINLLQDIGFNKGVYMLQEVKHSFHNLQHPGVPVYCLYSDGIPTAKTLVYTGRHFPDSLPDEVFGHGDGTINLRSLVACKDWKASPLNTKYPVVTGCFHSISHNHVLQQTVVHSQLKDILNSLRRYKIGNRQL